MTEEMTGEISTETMAEMTVDKFDYAAALAELERIASRVEDPSVGLEEIDACIRRSGELIEKCRAYLRCAREKLEQWDA